LPLRVSEVLTLWPATFRVALLQSDRYSGLATLAQGRA